MQNWEPLQILARLDDQIVAGRPDLVVEQDFEGWTGAETVCDQRHVAPSTQTSGTPRSHVRPEPSPRKNMALPRPTSILTLMVVRAPAGAGLAVATAAGRAGVCRGCHSGGLE